MFVCGGFEASVWRVGELLAVLVFVVDDAFEPQASEVLEHEVVVLGDAAVRPRGGSLVPRNHNFLFLIHQSSDYYKDQQVVLFILLPLQTLFRRLDTHFVSNSIKLVSMGGSSSGTAVTHAHALACHTAVTMETASRLHGNSEHDKEKTKM